MTRVRTIIHSMENTSSDDQKTELASTSISFTPLASVGESERLLLTSGLSYNPWTGIPFPVVRQASPESAITPIVEDPKPRRMELPEDDPA